MLQDMKFKRLYNKRKNNNNHDKTFFTFSEKIEMKNT